MFEPLQPSSGGPLPDRGRWRNAVNALVCLAGVGGLAFGGWALYDSYQSWQHRGESRTAIRAACADLLDPDAVMRLDGGRDWLVPSEVKSRKQLDLGQLPDECMLLSSYDEGGKTRWTTYFGLKVHSLPQQGLHVLDTDDDPFRTWSQRAAGTDLTDEVADPLPAPLGDGRAGTYSGRTVSVTAVCAQPVAGVTSFRATATARYGDPTDQDRKALAVLARTAALTAAERAGCAATAPELPAALPAQGRALGPAEQGTGSCAWYAAFLRGRQDRERLPDKALGVPVSEHGGIESCVLAMDTDTRKGVEPRLLAEGVAYGGPSERWTNPWWLRTFSSFGDDAAGTQWEAGATKATAIAAGQAGRGYRLLYASATCQGRPAVLGMTASFRYDTVLGPRFDEVFKAYATDTAQRRGCTELVLPAPE
ncbi:hypothetical protein ACFTWH_20155 [Streptomyces sp. NPDC057011]|uniref:hypothetical protein n=1 Tax=unclassified Streptomyces TaxID=2593676 RepID=UPI003644D49A